MDFDRLLGHIELLPFLQFLHEQKRPSIKEVQIKESGKLADAIAISSWSIPKIIWMDGKAVLGPKDINSLFTKEMKERLESELIAMRLTRMVACGQSVYRRVDIKDKNLIYVSGQESAQSKVIYERMDGKVFQRIMSQWRRLTLEDQLVFVGLSSYINSRNILLLYQELDKL